MSTLIPRIVRRQTQRRYAGDWHRISRHDQQLERQARVDALRYRALVIPAGWRAA